MATGCHPNCRKHPVKRALLIAAWRLSLLVIAIPMCAAFTVKFADAAGLQCKPINYSEGPPKQIITYSCTTDVKKLSCGDTDEATDLVKYSLPMAGYTLDQDSAKAYFDGHGTYSVQATVQPTPSGGVLSCLWRVTGGGPGGPGADVVGHCEVQATVNAPDR
jgi:hypothetical protein